MDYLLEGFSTQGLALDYRKGNKLHLESSVKSGIREEFWQKECNDWIPWEDSVYIIAFSGQHTSSAIELRYVA